MATTSAFVALGRKPAHVAARLHNPKVDPMQQRPFVRKVQKRGCVGGKEALRTSKNDVRQDTRVRHKEPLCP